jgi:hypothetical protein
LRRPRTARRALPRARPCRTRRRLAGPGLARACLARARLTGPGVASRRTASRGRADRRAGSVVPVVGVTSLIARQAKLLGDLHDNAEPLADLRLRHGAKEDLRDLPGHHGDDHRNALYLQRGAQLRVGIDVYLGEHPGAIRLIGEALQHRPELLTRPAPLRPQIQDHRHASRSLDDISAERIVGYLDDVPRLLG